MKVRTILTIAMAVALAVVGIELIRAIRADSRYSGIPILVISADTDPGTPKRAAQLGANAFFAKPYSPALLRRTLEQLLNATSK
jgi:CheY-like chemotaxis protein